MKYLIKKDLIFRIKHKTFELKALCLKFFLVYVFNVKHLKYKQYSFIKLFALQKLTNKFKNRVSKTILVRRCILTGRGRSSIRAVGNISRSSLKDLLLIGLIPGYKKAVW